MITANNGNGLMEVTEINSEARFDLQGHLEAVMASEATETITEVNLSLILYAFEVTYTHWPPRLFH